MRRFFVYFMLTALCAGAFGQSQAGKTPPPAAERALPSPPDGAGKPMEGTVAPVDPNKYLLGAEDVIFIRTWRQPDFTQSAVIRPDGKISMPLIGDLQAQGLTPQQLANNIKEQLTQYINNPDVTIFVQDVRSRKYYVDGEVNRTGLFSLVTPTTILEALSTAGGFHDFANLKDIHILRNGKILHFNYKQVIQGKHLEQNILVENGDHIIVR